MEDAKNNELETEKIIALIKKGEFNKVYCKDKWINKLLFDIGIEEKEIEVTVKDNKIVVRTSMGVETELKVENVNEYFGIY